MKQILSLLVLLFLAATPLSAKILNRVAAQVNNNIISTFQLDQAVAAAQERKNQAEPLSAEQQDLLRRQVLEQLINEELISQRIKTLNLRVSDAELDAAINDIKTKNNLNDEMLAQALAAEGLTLEEYRIRYRKELLRYKLLGREVNYKVQVAPSEIREYFQQHRDQYRAPAQLRISYLSYPLPPDANPQELKRMQILAADSRDRLQSGESVTQILALYGSEISGGDMGLVAEQDLSEQMRKALANLNVGQVSEPLETNGQLLLLLVTERHIEDDTPLDRYSAEIEQILEKEKTEARFQEWQQELRQESYVDIRL